MTEKTTKVEAPSPPWGFCTECCEKFVNGGIRGERFDVDGGQLWFAFCEHREVGAELSLREGRPPQWRLRLPVDMIEWVRYVASRRKILEGVFRAIDESNDPQKLDS